MTPLRRKFGSAPDGANSSNIIIDDTGWFDTLSNDDERFDRLDWRKYALASTGRSCEYTEVEFLLWRKWSKTGRRRWIYSKTHISGISLEPNNWVVQPDL